MKLLFITRTYPPIVGGMERFASEFYNNYQKFGEIDLLENPGGKKTFIPFLFRVFFFLVFHSKRYNIIHLYDAVLSPLIPVIKLFSNAKISVTVNGLDIVYSRLGYQRIILPFLKRANRIIAISNYTRDQCELRGVLREKSTVIPVGINFDNLQIFSMSEINETLARFKIPAMKAIKLITVGRLIKRKGHAWFIANVLNKLPENYIYIIVGSGPEQYALEELIRDLDLSNRVYLLGRVSEKEKNCLYQISDLFIMPNIGVRNDQEGFGIVLLEAGRYGLPVIATNIEGIRDAVIDRKTGYLIDEKDSQGFMNAITKPDIDRSSLTNEVVSNFDWKFIIERYNQEFEKMLTD